MKILIVSDAESSGGAAASTINLAIALANQGHKVYRLVTSPDGVGSSAWITIPFWARLTLVERIKSKLRKRLPLIIRKYLAERRFQKVIEQIKPDAINFHNILWAKSEGISIRFYEIASRKYLTLVTMHDMWNIMGYPYDYNHVEDERIINKSELSIENSKMISQRKSIFSQNNLFFVSPSNWLDTLFKSRFPENSSKVSVIPYGIDTDVYKPVEKSVSRSVLDIETNKVIILASAASLSYINKGFSILLEVLRQRSNSDLLLLLMGDDSEINPSVFPVDLQLKKFGFIRDKITKNLIYNAADFLAFPSIADNLPNSVIECISAGTPVLGFNTCGLPDLIKNGESGWLADKVDIENYKALFEKAVEDIKAGINLKSSCRSFALENFRLESQAIKYCELIKSLSK